MRRIDLTPYLVDILESDGTVNKQPVKIAENIENILLISGGFSTQQLGGKELLEHAKLADKILKGAEKGDVLLEEAEYETVRKSFECFRNFQRFHVELVRRVIDAERVEVAIKDADKDE